MMKWVVREFFSAHKWKMGFKNLIKNAVWVVIYVSLILPSIYEFYESPKSALVYAAVIIPMLLWLLISAIHPTFNLPKIMYMCPMNMKMRKEYVEKMALFKMAMIFIPVAIGVVILIFCGFDDIVCCCGVLFNGLIMALIGSGILYNGFESLLAGVSTFFLIISDVFYIALIAAGDFEYNWLKWILVLFSVMVQIPMTIKIIKCWKPAVDRAMSYNNSFISNLIKENRWRL